MNYIIKYVAVVACREAGSGEAHWYAAVGALGNGAWIGESPMPPPNRAGDYPKETIYDLVPHEGRYRNAGIHGVQKPHVKPLLDVLDGRANPHCRDRLYASDNWLDVDVPQHLIAAGIEWKRQCLLREADEVLWLAQHKADSLRRDAEELLR